MKENTPSYCSLLCPFHRFAVPLPRKRGRLLDLQSLKRKLRSVEAKLHSVTTAHITRDDLLRERGL